MRAVRLAQRIALDGRLDEDVYDLIPPIGGFVQQVPDPGAAATEPTEAWVMFDGANLYVAARCHDSAPPGEWVANDNGVGDAGQDLFGATAAMVGDLDGCVAGESGDGVLGLGDAVVGAEGRPSGEGLVLGDAGRVLARVAEGRLVQHAGQGAADVHEYEPNGSADC